MKTIDARSENNMNIMKGHVSDSEKVIEQYSVSKKNLDGTMKKDDLTILQEYAKR